MYLKPQILTCPRNVGLLCSEADGQSEGYAYIRNGITETVFHRTNTMAQYSSSHAYLHSYNEAHTVMYMFDAMARIIRKCDH